ncbi:MAG: sigma-54 dependent transcriptional regulator [Verrucomicrobiales bacterium]|nr:sigma-54 dependent transcriptional regulator [Verrucomicrobiales bacterium]
MDILIVDDEKTIRDSTMVAIEAEGHYVEAVDGAQVALLRMQEEPFDVVFIDLRLGDDDGLEVLKQVRKRFPKVVPIVFTAYATVDTAVKAIQLGAMDYLEKPFTPADLRSYLVRAEKQRRLAESEPPPGSKPAAPVAQAKPAVSSGNKSLEKSPAPIFQSQDKSMQGIYDIVFRAADTQASILILGESGTGKSVLAREIHQRSHLKDKPFVTVHCPSLSKELLESELFGHVKGAFTGAVKDQWGKVHAANGGTLFLDEIGELPLDIQPKLLRLLQEREYERVGESTTRTTDIRVIAATNRDLRKDIESGDFREDLFYRLNVISVEMPPLRKRPEDLRILSEEFLQYFVRETGRNIRGFSRSGMARLTGYPWPGNVRELRNALERAVILAVGDEIESEDLPSPGTDYHSGEANLSIGSDSTLEELEAAHLKQVLEKSASLQEAAATLGIDQATLYRKRKKLGLK